MRTQPIEPASIEFDAAPGGVPRSLRHDDVYHPRVGALAQAAHVFLGGNGLPGRWAGRDRYVVVETGFGLGNNFLATWDAWRRDPARCARLHFVSIERHPPRHADLARAHAASPLPGLAAALLAAWPPLTPNLHAIDFDGGRVQLLLAFGDVAVVLPALRLQADAFFLDGHAPSRNPAMWQPQVIRALGRRAAPGATLATWSVAGELRASLAAAGFEVQRAGGIGGKREITLARYAPRFAGRPLPGIAVPGNDAVVVGAGIAGAAAAQALARQGLAVTVLECEDEPACGASGMPAGLFHGTVMADDGRYARLFRAAALLARREHAAALAAGGIDGSCSGLLRLHAGAGGLPAMQALLRGQALPPDYVQAIDAAAAATMVGVPLAAPAWFYPGGGWLAPAAWVRQTLAADGVRLACRQRVAALVRDEDADTHAGGWRLLDRAGVTLAQAPIVVLANAADAGRLLADRGHPPWPLRHSRGQVTCWRGPHPLRLPLAGDGYALPLRDGLLCGATREDGEPDPAGAADVRAADHRLNLQRLQRLTGWQPPAAVAMLQGRTGWRLHSEDNLPIAGAVARAAMPAGQRLDQPRLLLREPGLFVLTALGARGLTLAPLLARLVAAMATGTPWPLEQDLADAVDPGRWAVRTARRLSGAGPAAAGLQPGG